MSPSKGVNKVTLQSYLKKLEEVSEAIDGIAFAMVQDKLLKEGLDPLKLKKALDKLEEAKMCLLKSGAHLDGSRVTEEGKYPLIMPGQPDLL